jgi:hypothetical protein
LVAILHGDDESEKNEEEWPTWRLFF